MSMSRRSWGFLGRVLDQGNSSRKGLTALVALVLLAAVCSAGALAEVTPADEANMIEWPTSEEALAEATVDATPISMPAVGQVSGPLTDLTRVEAAEVLDEAFGSALVEGAAEVYDELDIQEFRSDYVAVVLPDAGGGGSSRGLLSSSLPLRVENDQGDKELVDLDLEPVNGHFEPENPLVEVQIPSELSEGISFPQANITISVATGDTERTASEAGDATAFFPNIRTDSDVAITATPTGVETYTQLRSPDAPRSEVLDLTVPDNGHLTATDAGGAEVVDADGEVLLAVSAPWAIDAEGDQVPAALEVAGNSIIVTVDPPADAVYPILVDPIYESFHFTLMTGAYWDWVASSNPGFRARLYNGMTVEALQGATTPGNQGTFQYHVPRFWSDVNSGLEPPSTYIRNMKLWNLVYMMPYESYPYPAHPFMQMGLYSDVKQAFVSYGYRDGTSGPETNGSFVYDFTNSEDDVQVKHGGFAIATWSGSNPAYRYVQAQQASVEVSDKDSPALGDVGGVPQWVDTQPGSAIAYTVTDPGLGIHRLKMSFPAAPGGIWETVTSMGCVGASILPCPRTASNASKALSYNPGLMDQGENYVKVYAYDPVDHVSAGFKEARIKVDHTAPELATGGTLTEQVTVGVNQPSYTLNYNAADGDEAAPAPLSPLGSAGTGSGQLESPVGVAVDSKEDVWVSDLTNRKLVQYSKSGSVIRQVAALSPTFDPRGVAVAPDGNVWVADRASKMIVKLSPTGTYLGSVTTAAMSEPWGVAFGPGGEMWVSDLGAKRAFKFVGSELKLSIPLSPWYPGGTIAPVGIAVDRFGGPWIAIQGTSEGVLHLNSAGAFVSSFGSKGTGNGQFNSPTGIAIAKSGHVLVADAGNGRVQVFNTGGEFLRSFASTGSAANQLITPRGIAAGAGNTLYVVDTGNKRIATWSHADKDPQSGAAKLEIKVDGVAKETRTPGCATKNCVISGSWVMSADSYSVGKHKVEVIASDAVGRVSTKTYEVETHGDLSNPTVALSGSMTEQSTLGTTRPSYKLKVLASDPGLAEERKSGVASTSIKVDGALVDSTNPGCPAGGCSITREWTLNSNNYATGSHSVEVKATDAAGRSTVKTLSVSIARDVTAPTFASLDPFYTAPSGWVDQKTYRIQSLVTDADGYGVTSVQLKLDGSVVLSTTQTCPAGGCSKVFGSEPPLDMEPYSGGAHPAELIATDGAGNTRKRSWTVNVNPAGQIPAIEAVSTLQALEDVAEEEIVSPLTIDNAYYAGPDGNPILEEDTAGFHTDGAPAETTVSNDAADGFTVETPEGPVAVTPLGTDATASPVNLASDAAVVASNTDASVDSVLLPIFDGAMTFQSIRDRTAVETFSWSVTLHEEQYLEPIDSDTAVVYWNPEHPAFTIQAGLAHDADGSSVPTTLNVSGQNIITLTVNHRAGNPAAGYAPFVYPIIAGAGWEGGFKTHYIEMPPPSVPVTEQPTPTNLETIVSYELQVGAPEPVPESEADGGGATASSASRERRRKFLRSVCAHSAEWWESNDGGRAIAEGKSEGAYCGNSFDPVNHPGIAVLWRGNMRGAFLYTPGVKVRHNGAIACAKGIPTASRIKFYGMKEAYECRYGPKTSDGNGGVHADAGHYLRAQAHWELGQRSKCYGNQPSEECTPPDTCWEWMDRALELHLWPSGNIDPIKLLVAPPPGNC
jgi:NHL repeat